VPYRLLADFQERERLAMVPHTTRRFACRSALALSPDARQIAFVSDQGSGTFEAFSVPVQGGTPVRMLDLEGGAIRSLCWSPRGELIGAADRGGTEMHQLYLRHPDGPVAPLSVDPAGKIQRLLSWNAASPAGRSVAFTSNARTPTDMDIVVVDTSGAGERTMVAGPAWHVAGGWSPEGGELLVMRVLDNTTQDLLIVDARSGSVREITRHREDVQHVPAGWLADGRVAMITDEGSEHLYLAALHAETGAVERIDAPNWDIELAASSQDGRVQVWTVNEDGYSKLRWRRDGKSQTLDLRGVCLDLIVSGDGSIAAYSRYGTRDVWEVCVLDTRSGQARVIATTTRAVRADDLVEPEIVRIPAADGPIPCFVYRPKGARGPTPAILTPHGGPEGQSRPGLLPVHEALLTRGVAVVVPNIHGSTGYGRSWQTAIHKDWGGIDLRDLTAVADWMASRPDFDRARLAVHGGSYGGFATLLCVSRMPERWRCGVDICGWGDLVLALQTKEPNWKRFMERWVGKLPDDEEKLRLRSPITYIDDVRCPMLILQGEKDTRVAKVASDQVVERLRANGCPVEYVVYPDEGHGFTKKENVVDAQERVLAFLTRELLEA
jgi:dipeptidyl aminopeptidase/acylaminoacyl peptidase